MNLETDSKETKQGDLTEHDIHESRWLLMGKQGRQKIIIHRFGFVMFIALLLIPFLLLLDMLIQRLWGWFFAYLITIGVMGALQAAVGAASTIAVMGLGFSFCLFYCFQRHDAVRQNLLERDWLVLAGSKEFFQFKAVREWKSSGIDVKDPFRNPRLPS